MDPDSTKSWHKGTPRIRCPTLFSPPPPTLHPKSRVADHHLSIPGCRPGGRGAGRGWGRGPGPWEEAGHVTPSARTGCQAGSAAKARVVAAGAEPERRGTGRRGPGTAAPGELPCHGEAGGRAGRAALEHGRFPARPHRQPLPPAHARLPRARYRVSREETLWRGGRRTVGTSLRWSWRDYEMHSVQVPALPVLSDGSLACLLGQLPGQPEPPSPGSAFWPNLGTGLETGGRAGRKFSVPSGASSAAESLD